MKSTQKINHEMQPKLFAQVMSGKELADALGKHRTFISAMKRAGFKPHAPPNFFRLDAAVKWLEAHPGFRQTRAYPSKIPKVRRTVATCSNIAAVAKTVDRARV